MKIKLATLFLFLVGNLFAQEGDTQSAPNAYFQSSGNTSINCGGKLITGQMYLTNSEFGEDNKFYLEIAAENSSKFSKIEAQKTDLINTSKAQFLLPDTLKIGSFYTLRMSSTNPKATSKNATIRYGAGLLPYSVDFNQEQFFTKSIPIPVTFKINSEVFKRDENGNVTTDDSNFSFDLKLSDGSKFKYNIYSYEAVSVVPKDSISIFKITEIMNTCGVKGEVKGEAKLIRKDFLEGIKITNENYERVCEGAKFRIGFSSKLITSKTILKVAFSDDYNALSNVTIADAIVTENNYILVDIPQNREQYRNYYYRIFSDLPRMVSNTNTYFSEKNSTNVRPSAYTRNPDEISIFFAQSSDLNPNYNSSFDFKEAIVNGIDVSDKIINNVWSFPKPKKDTVLQFTKLVNTCGLLKISNQTLIIKPKDYPSFKFLTKEDTLCIGQTAEVGYEISDEDLMDKIGFGAFIYAYGNEYDIKTKRYSGNGSIAYYGLLKVIVNKLKKTVSVFIPNEVDDAIKSQFKNKNIKIQGLKLVIDITSYSGQNLSSSRSTINLKLKPTLELITPKIEINGAGYVDIPIKFTGGSQIKYKLSNDQSGAINHFVELNNSEPTNGGTEVIRAYFDKTTNLKFLSAQNECGSATLQGETNIIVNADKPGIVIDESKLEKDVCLNSELKIEFKKFGIWSKEPEYKLFSKITNSRTSTSFISNKIIISTSETTFKIDNYNGYDKLEIWLEDVKTNIKSNSILFNVVTQPREFNVASSTYFVSSYQNNTETISILKDELDPRINVSSLGENVFFTIENKKIKNSLTLSNFSIYLLDLGLKKDTTFTVQSMSNACGTVDLNRKIKFEQVETLLFAEDQTESRFFIPTTNCGGSKRILSINYKGKIPTKDSLIIQFAKYDSFQRIDYSKLIYFDVPTKKIGNELYFTIPENLYGSYTYRIKSLTNNSFSNSNYYYEINQKPKVKLTSASGKTEIIGIPSGLLYLNPNPDPNNSLNVVMNDGSRYTTGEFGLYHYRNYKNDGSLDKLVFDNRGKYFEPTETTTYSLKSAYNECGLGTVEGSVTIKVLPTIQNELANYSFNLDNAFCNGDSVTLDLRYTSNFPSDTLMGVYLYSPSKVAFNQELTTFKNNPKSISFKLPKDVNSGYYYLQTKKKSRGKLFPKIYNRKDSLQYIETIQNFDARILNIRIATPPTINLSGNTEIFEGGSANLLVDVLNQKGENPLKSKDTVDYVGGVTSYYKLSDGKTYSTRSTSITVKPPKTETFTIGSIKNACGIGKATGSATVTVYPKSDKRIETIGFYRSREVYLDVFSYRYNYNLNACSGIKDSIDIKAYGIDTTNLSKFKVALSDKEGNNYSILKTDKAAFIDYLGPEGNKGIIRLWYELPENLTYGTKYKIKGVLSDSDINSTPLNSFGTIRELPTASLSGNASVLTGQKVEALVKLAGDAPWFFSLVDKENQIIFSNLPTKKDTIENFRNYNSNYVYDSEFKVELNPNKSTTYKIDKVYNYFCGFGKTNGELKVELILSSESTPEPVLQVFPNPTTAEINLNLSTLKNNTVVETYSILGNLLHSQTYSINELNEQQKIDFSRFNSGIYLMKIRSGKFAQTYRIVKL